MKSNDIPGYMARAEELLTVSKVNLEHNFPADSVGRPLVQAFAGALQGERAKKGIMLTTSSFTKDAIEFAKTIENKIVLIDGEQLVEYMIDYDLGVSKISSYEIKCLDSDYFSDE